MINQYIISSDLVWTTTVILVVFVFLRERHSPLSKAFCFFMINVAYGISVGPGWRTPTIPLPAFFWARALHIGASIIPSGFLHFALALQPRENSLKWRPVARLGYAIAAFFCLSVSPRCLSHIQPMFPASPITPNPALFMFRMSLSSFFTHQCPSGSSPTITKEARTRRKYNLGLY